jgi:hypothetical protein
VVSGGCGKDGQDSLEAGFRGFGAGFGLNDGIKGRPEPDPVVHPVSCDRDSVHVIEPFCARDGQPLTACMNPRPMINRRRKPPTVTREAQQKGIAHQTPDLDESAPAVLPSS